MIHSLLKHGLEILKAVKNPRLEAEILLAFVLNTPRTYLHAYPEQILEKSQKEEFEHLLKRRLIGEPIAYLIGKKEFWSLTLQVSPDVLIPRPETERLVELVLETLPKVPAQSVVDLGTGSGAIALALAKERPHWRIVATDHSSNALQVAKRNARDLGLQNIEFYLGDWYAALPKERYNAMVSNPPYIAEDDPHLALDDLRFEPQSALIAAERGLADLRFIISQAMNYLVPKGCLWVEHGYQQGFAVNQLMQETLYKNVTTHKDLAGHDRVTGGYL